MERRPPICAAIALVLLPVWGWAAERQEAKPASKPTDEQSFSPMVGPDGNPVALAEEAGYSEWGARAGWWAFWHTGSPQKVGQYQDLSPSPFWDVDGVTSDGRRTAEFSATGTDNETTRARLRYFQQNVSANVDYDRYIHQRTHDPLNNMLGPTDPLPPDMNGVVQSAQTPQSAGLPGPMVIKQDLSLGQDYAVRVQEFKGSFKWQASDNLKARLDVWGMEKDGTRQVNAVAMCYSQDATVPPDHPPVVDAFAGRRCHVLSQSQRIDWVTTEVKPVIEARLGDNFVVEYSRPMRGFTASDQTTSRFYNNAGILSYDPVTNPNPFAYSVAPNNYTEMDQVKIRGRITDDTTAYASLMAGHTANREIDMDRWFNNTDLRLTNTSITNVTLTGYGRIFNEDEHMADPTAVTNVNQGPAVNGVKNTSPTLADITGALSEPIDYHKSTAGMKGVWRVRGNGFEQGGLAILGGYEYNDLERKNAIYSNDVTGGVIDQSRTITHGFQIGPDYRWSAALDTYVRYKYQIADQPLLGLQEANGLTNTLLPQHDHIVEVGFNWVPADWFILNACLGIETGDTNGTFSGSSNAASFTEQNYPLTISAWYAVSNRWSFSAGYAVYSNFVAQNINLADQRSFPAETDSVAPVTGRWNYGGRSQVVTFGSRYAASECVSLTGQLEWVRGRNLISNSTMVFPAVAPQTTPITVTDLGSFSQVLNETTRLTMGVDWLVRPRVVTYIRYELYNFNDLFPGYQTGLAQGILGGFSAIF